MFWYRNSGVVTSRTSIRSDRYTDRCSSTEGFNYAGEPSYYVPESYTDETKNYDADATPNLTMPHRFRHLPRYHKWIFARFRHRLNTNIGIEQHELIRVVSAIMLLKGTRHITVNNIEILVRCKSSYYLNFGLKWMLCPLQILRSILSRSYVQYGEPYI